MNEAHWAFSEKHAPASAQYTEKYHPVCRLRMLCWAKEMNITAHLSSLHSPD